MKRRTTRPESPEIELSPLITHMDVTTGPLCPLPDELQSLYGELRFPSMSTGPWIIANVVSTIDGVVALGDGGASGGSDISGGNAHDRMVMGLLRAAVDVIVVGAGTLRASPRHTWTPRSVFRSLDDAFQTFRQSLGKSPIPAVAVVSAAGNVDPELPLFRVTDRVVILTTTTGKRNIANRSPASSAEVLAVADAGDLDPDVIVRAIQAWYPSRLILVEGGPHLLGCFVAGRSLDELFLTISPQVAGRDASVARLGLVEGSHFGPADPRWSTLVSVKRAESHLFLRYVFERIRSS